MKNVVITGSSKGIGKGYAREFLKRGHNVAICGRSKASIDHALAELERDATNGAKVIGQVCDVADEIQLQALWDLAETQFGCVDIWINNAGFARSGVTLLTLKSEEIKAMIDANVIGGMKAAQIAMNGMKEQEGGGHIYMTMGAGHDGAVIPGMIGYGTTKRAVHYFAESLVNETKGTSIRVSTISPGMNVTEGMLEQMQSAAATMSPEEIKKMFRPINIMGDYVETTTPWTVDQILQNNNQHGNHIAWMTKTKLLGRFISALFTKRDLISRFNITPAQEPSVHAQEVKS